MSESTHATDPSPVDIRIVDNSVESRYEARSGERILGIIEYRLDPHGRRIVLVHTEVRPEAEGQGIGSRLAKHALDDIRSRGLKLTVECPFVSAYLRRHPGTYDDLIRR